jgi:hypothetical protein
LSAFQKGDLVEIIATEHRGCVTTVEASCNCLTPILVGSPYCRLTGFANNCFHEGALRRIGGERPKEVIEETRDEPVAA